MAEVTTPTTPVETQTPAAPSAEQNNGSPAKPENGKEPMIPKHRLDEESQKRQEAEARATAAEKKAEEALASSKAVNDKLSNLATALQGGDLTQKQVESEVAKIATKYNVPEEFVTDMMQMAEQRVARKFEPDLKAAKLAQNETGFVQEFDKLVAEMPEAANLTPQEKAELKAIAFKKEFLNTPLKSIYRDMMYDKPHGKKATAESGRGGGKTLNNGEPDIKSMSLEEFEKFSNEKGKRG